MLPFIDIADLIVAAIALEWHNSFLAIAAYGTRDECEQCSKITWECDWYKCGNWDANK